MLLLRSPLRPASLAAVAAALLLAAPASAMRLDAIVSDIPEAGPQDLWEIEYVPVGIDLQANDAFSVLFDPTLYALLQDALPAEHPDWDVLVLQPSTTLPDFGRYEPLARTDDPDPTHRTKVRFVWLGDSEGPGAQPWELVRFDEQGNLLEVLLPDQTTNVVPEPGVLALLGTGLAGLLRSTRERS